MLSPDGYTFDEEAIIAHEDGARAWDRLTHLWRSWFSLESLNGLTALLIAERDGTKIHLKAKESFGTPSSNDKLSSLVNVSIALADNITAGMAGLLAFNPAGRGVLQLPEIEARLESEHINLRLEIIIRKLGGLSLRNFDYDEVRSAIEEGVRLFIENERIDPIAITTLSHFVKNFGHPRLKAHFFEMLFRRMNPGSFLELPPFILIEILQFGVQGADREYPRYIFEDLFRSIHPRYFLDISLDVAVELLEIASQTNEHRFVEYLLRETIERSFHPRHTREMAPASVVKLMKLAGEYGYLKAIDTIPMQFIEHYLHPRYFLEGSSDLVIELLSLTKGNLEYEFTGRFIQELFSILQNPRYLMRVPPVNILKLLRLAREIGHNDSFKEIPEEFLERIANPRFLVRLTPEMTVEAIHLARVTGKIKQIRAFYEEACSRLDSRFWLHKLGIEVLRLARDFDDTKFLQRFFHSGAKRTNGNSSSRSRINKFREGLIQQGIDLLSLNELIDLRQLARHYDDSEVLAEIQRRTEAL